MPAAKGAAPVMPVIDALDRVVAIILRGMRWVALPVVVLLFLQWPLRDLFRAYSREANDLGQWLFALYVSAAFTAATRTHLHLSVDALARHYSNGTRRLIWRLAVLGALLPWAAFIAFAGARLVTSALAAAESFPDTDNPGYFIIKLALWVLSASVIAQGLVDLARPPSTEPQA
jgi:TRAP-type mannitol/chloroaromatic compound transport system permease small subunit